MKIDEDRCIRCRSCIAYCPVGAIEASAEKVFIVQDVCVECGVCLRSGSCQYDAIYRQELEWPRALRAQFSDPVKAHPDTGIPGRGTCEMKTNEVTGRLREGEVGFAIEMGRPGISTSFGDVETVTMALAGAVEFEPLNPVTFLIDTRTGRLKDDRVREERALSVIIECKTTEDRGLDVLHIIEEASKEIDTVFSLCVVNRYSDHGVPFKEIMETAGYVPRINGKTNVGLGRPLA